MSIEGLSELAATLSERETLLALAERFELKALVQIDWLSRNANWPGYDERMAKAANAITIANFLRARAAIEGIDHAE